MPTAPSEFLAFVTRRREGILDRAVETFPRTQLGDGDVLVRVHWSGVNYKDGLACSPTGKVTRVSPLIPGIDLAGTVVESDAAEFAPGMKVIAHGYDIGVTHHGGYSEYARLPAQWLVPLPPGLDLRQAMVLGTAGFTAALSVRALEAHGIDPAGGPILVTGASGGVGSIAVGLLAQRGYHVVASTGNEAATPLLQQLGATEIVKRLDTSDRPLDSETWAGAVDSVGGATLAQVLRTLSYRGAVAASGNAGGAELHTTVFPLILRGVSLLGIDSVRCPIPERRTVWNDLAERYEISELTPIAQAETDLAGLSKVLDAILDGAITGRTIVRLTSE